MEQIIIEKYYTEDDEGNIIYDTDSIREEFETQIELLENHNENI